MVAGGRDSDVGVGGLILWGVVTRGSVNAQEHSDLFVSLKGGGNNFGVATRFDMKAFDFSTMWGGRKVFSNETMDAQIQAFLSTSTKSPTQILAPL